MHKKKIIVIGAGLTGLSAAFHLQKKGIECQIFEKETESGGLCRSKNINGFTFDCVGHLLHFKHHYTFKLIKNILKVDLAEYRRNAYIYTRNRYIRYPFQINLHNLPRPVIKDCLLGYIQASKNNNHKNKNNVSFFTWINQIFGKGIANNFMIPYNKKFWTVSLKELTCDWLDGFIPVPSISQIIQGTLHDSKKLFGYNAHFWYPAKGGIHQIAKAFQDRTKNIYTNSQIEEIDLEKKVMMTRSGEKVLFDYLISTIPLPELPNLIKGIPSVIRSSFSKLRWNSILNLNLGIAKNGDMGRHWIYYPQKELDFFRVGFYHNFSSSIIPCGKGSIYVETSYSKSKRIDKNKIIPSIIKKLIKTEVIESENKIYCKDINDIKYGYPIYDKNYGSTREEIINFLLKKNVISCGRYGGWRYASMEDVILEGKEIADKLCIKKL